MTDLPPPPPPARDRGIGAIATWKITRGSLLALLAIGLAATYPSGTSVRLANQAAGWLAREFSSELLREIAAWISAHLTPGLVGVTSLVIALDAALNVVQGLGLLYRRRWAAWLTVITTSGLIPLEIWHLVVSPRWPRVLLLAGNLAIVAYLYLRARKHAELWAAPRV